MQTSFSENPEIGVEGGFADTVLRTVLTVIVGLAAGIKPGRLVVNTLASDSDEVPSVILPIDDPAVDMAADVDAFATATATAAGVLTLDSAGEFAGVIGLTELYVARRGTMVLNSHADWNATQAVWTYINHLGKRVSEVLTIPDGGNTTLYTTGYIAKTISFVLDAQAGVGGSFTLGVAAAGEDTATAGARFNARRGLGFLVYEDMKTGSPPDYAYADRATHAQYDAAGKMVRGHLHLKPEDAVTRGQEVWVRITAVAPEEVGRVRGTPDSTDCVKLEGCMFLSAADADGIAVAEVNLGV